MALDQLLLDILACPEDKGPLLYFEDESVRLSIWCIDYGEFGIALIEGIDRAKKSQVTKFVERHRRILREWLDIVLPPETIRADEEHFERRFGLRPIWRGDDLTLFWGGKARRVTLVDPQAQTASSEGASARVMAPMPGRLVQVKVIEGQEVRRGETLLVLEAMKMEHALLAPTDGRIAAVHFKEGEQVEEGAELLSFLDPEEGTAS